jgi:hypothetical protein
MSVITGFVVIYLTTAAVEYGRGSILGSIYSIMFYAVGMFIEVAFLNASVVTFVTIEFMERNWRIRR